MTPANPGANVAFCMSQRSQRPSRRPLVDLTALITPYERAKLLELEAQGLHADTLRRLIADTVRGRTSAAIR